MVLDGTTGLNMLPQAREFNQVASFLILEEDTLNLRILPMYLASMHAVGLLIFAGKFLVEVH
jgi:hypothetical protein